MSTDHARDDWADAQLGETLHRTLDGLAGQAATASSIEEALGSVRTRVRRRRAAKKAGLGVTTLAVTGGLVVGGSALVPQDPVDLPPQPAGTPTTSGTPTPSETADGAALDVIEDGYQPGWLEGTGLVCGMGVADLPAADAALELAGRLEDDPQVGVGTGDRTPMWRIPTRLAPSGGEAGVLMGPTLLWAQDGRVVDVGLDGTEDPVPVPGEGGTVDRDATDWRHTTCAPGGPVEGGTTSYETVLPAGEYEVRAYYQLWSEDFGDLRLVLSEPFTVVLDADGDVAR
jgi:hypothetical protein